MPGRLVLHVQRFLCSRLAQADLAAAAKVQLQTAKNGGGTWQLHSDLTDGLLCAQSGLGVLQAGIHGVFLKDSFGMNILFNKIHVASIF